MKKKLAKISSATFEIKERGVLNFWVFVDYEEGCSQGVGGLVLDDYDKELESRIGTAYGCEMIRQLLLFFGVNNLPEAKGQLVYVVGEGEGLSFKPCGFEHLKVEKNGRQAGLLFSDILKMFESEVASND
ncbi:hypothetical protein D3C85_584590 [compost metagenome]